MENKINKYPRVLLISNTALRRDNSNGNTLLNHLSTLPKENLISFYIQNVLPDLNSASSYFRITDKEKLKHFFSKRKGNGKVISNSDIENKQSNNIVNAGKNKHVRESALGHLIREFIWKYGKWDKSLLESWIEEFNPTVILLMVGRSSFMMNITRELSIKYNIPVVVFTTEDEYFHRYPWYRFIKNYLQIKLKKSYEKCFEQVSKVIAHHDGLNKLFRHEFNKETITIYPSSDISIDESYVPNGSSGILYIGNMEPNRIYSLIDISKCLESLFPKEIINIYSSDLTRKTKKIIKGLNNVIIHKPVSKEESIKLMKNAKLLLHFESFRKKDRVLIENSFSGKLPNYLSVGVPMLIYAPNYCSLSSYFSNSGASECYVSDFSNLKNRLFNFISDPLIRESIRLNILELSKHNHLVSENSKKFIYELK